MNSSGRFVGGPLGGLLGGLLGGPLGGPCEGPLGGPLGDLLGLNDCLINSEIYVIFSFFRGAQL